MFIRKQVLQQHYTDKPDLDDIISIIDFSRDANNSISSKFKLETNGKQETVAQKS